jgi:hypothetical protein
MLGASDATFEPLMKPAVTAGFGPKAPTTLENIVDRLVLEGVVTPINAKTKTKKDKLGHEFEYIGEGAVREQWDRLSKREQSFYLNRASAPLTRHSEGLLLSEGSFTIPLGKLSAMLRKGQIPTSLLAGLWIGSGESGTSDNAGMSQGGTTTGVVGLDMARKGHGVVPKGLFIHGSNTALFNYAELRMTNDVLRARAMKDVIVSAMMALTGHSMAVAAGVGMVMGVRSLIAQEMPRLMNFDRADMDPRYKARNTEILERMSLESGVYRGPLEAIMVQAYGFADTGANFVVKHVPQDIDAAAEVLSDYQGVTDEDIAIFKGEAPKTQEFERLYEEAMRKGNKTHADVIRDLSYLGNKSRDEILGGLG